ncbi:MAG TPA: hypothetical protein VF188_08230 [Longimicrobiales bacterium]
MSPRSIVLAENLFSAAAYPGHVVMASEEPEGTEAFRVGTGRRHALTNRWTPDTANAEHWVQVTCDQVRAADMLAIDRGHNLAGQTVELRISDDGFTTSETTVSFTVPSAAGGAQSLDDGVLTEEGAYLRRFPLAAATQWRLVIPAMGVGLRPQIVGLYLGLSLALPPLRMPWAEEETDLAFQEVRTAAGWIGAGEIARARVGELRVRLEDYLAYDQARLHLEGHFGRRRPMWIVYDDRQAERAALAVRPQGRAGFRFDSGWAYRQQDLVWQEHEPRVL